MKNILPISIVASVALCFGGCNESVDHKHADDSGTHEHSGDSHEHQESPSDQSIETASNQGHTHADGSSHDDYAEPAADVNPESAIDMHNEVPLGTIMFGESQAVVAQGHGVVEAAKEGHLVVVLPDTLDATIVRAWIGSEDRTLSMVGKDEYSEGGRFDIHSIAPSPLPENPMWWVEIEMADGTKLIGSIKPSMD